MPLYSTALDKSGSYFCLIIRLVLLFDVIWCNLFIQKQG